MPTVRESKDKCKIYIFMLLLSSGFSQIKSFLCHDRLTFSISQKNGGGGQLPPLPPPPGSDATAVAFRAAPLFSGRIVPRVARLHKSRSSRFELEFDLSNFV